MTVFVNLLLKWIAVVSNEEKKDNPPYYAVSIVSVTL